MTRKKSLEIILVTKASGELAPFSKEKLKNSLKKAGASEEDCQKIISEIEEMLYPGIHTKHIYKKAFSLLRKSSKPNAARYKLKKAIMQLGPTGYPFEKYVGEILALEGYQVQIGQIVSGQCVQHEVDVIAEKNNKHFMIECKFHSSPGRKCDVKIPLYIHSRFLDVEKAWQREPGHDKIFHQGWLVTNTRFSTDAIQLGECIGLNMISWSYPLKNGLQERIDRFGLHPLTCLTTLTKREKQKLIDRKIVLCKELCKREDLLQEIGISPNRIPKILKEGRLLCEENVLI